MAGPCMVSHTSKFQCGLSQVQDDNHLGLRQHRHRTPSYHKDPFYSCKKSAEENDYTLGVQYPQLRQSMTSPLFRLYHMYTIPTLEPINLQIVPSIHPGS